MISNRGGYQSESKEIFLENSFTPFKKKIMPAINELVKEFNIIRPIKIVQMWVNVNGQYCYNTSHKHAGVDLSGVLWINQTEETGVFVFENNEAGLQTAALNAATKWEHIQSQNINFEYVPQYKDGTLCIFPAYLSHRVEINLTNINRISISFNIKII